MLKPLFCFVCKKHYFSYIKKLDKIIYPDYFMKILEDKKDLELNIPSLEYKLKIAKKNLEEVKNKIK